MLSQIILLALLPCLISASPLNERWTAQPYVGSYTADVYPPPSGKYAASRVHLKLITSYGRPIIVPWRVSDRLSRNHSNRSRACRDPNRPSLRIQRPACLELPSCHGRTPRRRLFIQIQHVQNLGKSRSVVLGRIVCVRSARCFAENPRRMRDHAGSLAVPTRSEVPDDRSTSFGLRRAIAECHQAEWGLVKLGRPGFLERVDL